MSSALISPSTSLGKMQPKKKHLNNKARITQIGSLGFEPACGGVMKGSGSCSHCPGRVRWRRRIRVALSNADGNVHLSFVSQSLGRPGHRGNPALPSPAEPCLSASKPAPWQQSLDVNRFCLHSLPRRLYQAEQQTLFCATGRQTRR